MSFNPAKLRSCPECGGHWPKGPDFALRGCDWLHGLPRKISPSNDDVLLHDDEHGRDRFLQLEMKSSREKWPPAIGQVRTLKALAGLPNWTVRILRGRTDSVDVYRVTSSGIIDSAVRTHAEALRVMVSDWLNGQPWRDDFPAPIPGAPAPGHVCGWARVEGLWTCVQDHYSDGFQPETGCGKTLPQYA